MKPEITPDFKINKLISDRWSGRAYAHKPVEEKTLYRLFEAVRWSASSYNEQPWRFIVVKKGTDSYIKLLNTLSPFNQAWAKDAPVLILTIVKKRFSQIDSINRHAFHDMGLAIGNFSLQGTELGLNLHQMAGFDAQKAQNEFKIPSEYEPVTVIALGYHGNPEQLEEPLKGRELAPQERKPIQEFVYKADWEKPIF